MPSGYSAQFPGSELTDILYPAGYGENPNVPLSIRDRLGQLFSFDALAPARFRYPRSTPSMSLAPFAPFSFSGGKSAVKKAKPKK